MDLCASPLKRAKIANIIIVYHLFLWAPLGARAGYKFNKPVKSTLLSLDLFSQKKMEVKVKK